MPAAVKANPRCATSSNCVARTIRGDASSREQLKAPRLGTPAPPSHGHHRGQKLVGRVWGGASPRPADEALEVQQRMLQVLTAGIVRRELLEVGVGELLGGHVKGGGDPCGW